MPNLPPMTEEEAELLCAKILHSTAKINASNWEQFAFFVQFDVRKGWKVLGFSSMKAWLQKFIEEDDLDLDSMKETGCPMERWGL